MLTATCPLVSCPFLQPEDARYPTDMQQDAVPLIGKLEFQEGFQKPMQQVWAACQH
jgi:hypothetical protein